MSEPDAVRAQYARRASAYARSQGHARGPDLERLLALLAPQPEHTALDVATGTGFTAIALARQVLSVVALDLTPEMLAEGQRMADEADVTNVEFVAGDAHALPFADGKFDLVTARRAPHHFADPPRAFREMCRVLKPRGRLGLVDQITPEEDDAGALLEDVEHLRDPSHVRALTVHEWKRLLPAAGFQLGQWEVHLERHTVAEWLQLAGTPPDVAGDIARRLARAPAAVRQRLGNENGARASFVRELIVAVASKSSP